MATLRRFKKFFDSYGGTPTIEKMDVILSIKRECFFNHPCDDPDQLIWYVPDNSFIMGDVYIRRIAVTHKSSKREFISRYISLMNHDWVSKNPDDYIFISRSDLSHPTFLQLYSPYYIISQLLYHWHILLDSSPSMA
jgi:hypothetical protein